MKNNYAINAVVAGEVSPKFYGRFDTQPFAQSCEEMTNMIGFPQGGAGTRPGTFMVQEVQRAKKQNGVDIEGDTFSDARVFPFTAANGQRIMIVAKNRAPWYKAGTTDNPVDIGALNGSPGWYAIDVESGVVIKLSINDPSENVIAITAFGIDYTPDYHFDNLVIPGEAVPGIDMREIQYAQSGNRIYFAHKWMRPFYLEFKAPPSVTVQTFTFGYAAFPLLPRQFSETEQFGNADRIPFQNPNFPPVNPGTFTQYTALKLNVVTFPPTYTQLLEATVTVDPAVPSTFQLHSGWVGRYLKFSSGSKTSAWVVFAYSTPAGVPTLTLKWIAGVLNANNVYFGKDTGSNWELSYWGGSLGWPATLTFADSRLIFGGCPGSPDTYWASQLNNIENFRTRRFEQDPSFTDPITDIDAFVSNLKEETIAEIRWLITNENITAGGQAREFIIRGSDPNASLSALNQGSSAETPHGSAYLQPARLENTTVFLQRHRRAFREMVYSLDEGSFKADDLNIFAEHIAGRSALEKLDSFIYPESYFVQLAMQQVPNGILWTIDNNGSLCGLTRERTQQVQSWHFHELGGMSKFTVGGVHKDYKPRIRSIAVNSRSLKGRFNPTQDFESEVDELWMTVQRGVKVSSVWVKKLYIEKLAPFWTKPTIEGNWVGGAFSPGTYPPNWRQIAPVYMDQSVIIDNDQYNNDFYNLAYAAGQMVSVNVQGHDLGEFLVSDTGLIDIDTKLADLVLPSVYLILIGFKYTSRVIPCVAETQAQLGSSHGQKRKIAAVVINFLRTVGATLYRKKSDIDENTPISNAEQVNFPIPSDGTPRQMWSLQKRINFTMGHEERPRIVLENTRPLPMNFTHMVVKQQVNET